MGVRFEHELMTDPFNLGEPVYGSRLVACYTLDDPKYRLTDRRTDHDSFEEGTGACVVCVLFNVRRDCIIVLVTRVGFWTAQN